MQLVHADDRVSPGKVSVKRQRPFALRDCPLGSVGEAIREIIENHLGRAIVCRDQITITLRSGDLLDAASRQRDVPTISVPFKATLPLRKGISHGPSGGQAIDEATRSALLMAIARSRGRARFDFNLM
jgi:hypothetical protein